MFSSVGWGEILVLLIVGIVVVGPERLPRIINDVKAMILAARNAISSAREEMGDDFAEDFEDFRKPFQQLNEVRRMGAGGLVSKALLDDDPEFLQGLQNSVRGVTGTVKGTVSEVRHGPSSQVQTPSSSGAEQSVDPVDPVVPGDSGRPGDRGPSGDSGEPGGSAADWSSVSDGDVL